MWTQEDENSTSSLAGNFNTLLRIPTGDVPYRGQAQNDGTVNYNLCHNGKFQLPDVTEHYGPAGRNEADFHRPREPNRLSETGDPETDDVPSQNIEQTHFHEPHLPIPRYPDYALKTVRMTSFRSWPNHLKPAGMMAEGGFFHSTTSDSADCVRCFQCGIGLKNWDPEDDPWVEHARWSSKCPYLRLKKGQTFIDLVQAAVRQAQIEETLEQNSRDTNSRDDVDVDAPLASETERAAAATFTPTAAERKNPLLTSAAQSVLEIGYLPKVVKKAVDEVLQQKGWIGMNGQNILGVIFKYEEEEQQKSEMKNESIERKLKVPNNLPQKSKRIPQSNDRDALRAENEQLKEQKTCKICCENIVSIVFLPCGHLVCCAQCSSALKDCPVCRTTVKGTVRVCLA